MKVSAITPARAAPAIDRAAPEPPLRYTGPTIGDTMKSRQFAQLAGVSQKRRDTLLLEGLYLIADNVERLALEVDQCDSAGACRAAELTYNAGREEAGKFLILADLFRAPHLARKDLKPQLIRTKDHLAKLLYAQMADYRIADEDELFRMVAIHKQELYLDGPTGADFIFRNDLLTQREDAMYVDLIESEGDLAWSGPTEHRLHGVADCMRLAVAIRDCGLLTADGIAALRQAWDGFHPNPDAEHLQTHATNWQDRTRQAVASLRAATTPNKSRSAKFVIDRWPMPMVDVPLQMERHKPEEMAARRQQLEADAAWA